MPITDLTSLLKDHNYLGKTLEDQRKGSLIVAKVKHLNESKNLSQQDFISMMADSDLSLIERLLWQGSIVTALDIITNLSSSFFTSEEKQEIIDFINEVNQI